jgi:hypothetical protein
MRKALLISVFGGSVLSLVSGLFPNPFSGILLGVALWGTPLPWITQVIYPNAPRVLHWPELVVDVAFWSLIIYAGYSHIKMRKASLAPAG